MFGHSECFLHNMNSFTELFWISWLDKTSVYDKHDDWVTFTYAYSDENVSTNWILVQGDFVLYWLDKTLKYEEHDDFVNVTFGYSDKEISTKWFVVQGDFVFSYLSKTFTIWQARRLVYFYVWTFR